MADIEKLPLAEIRQLVESIQYGSPLEASFYERYPWITTLSQERVREIYGDHFSVWTFQGLPIHSDIRKPEIQMVTANPRRMWIEMSDDRTFSWGLTNKNVEREQVVLKYEMTPERVIVYMPLLIMFVLDTSDTLGHWKTKYGKSLKSVLTKSLYELQEEKLLVDVRGLEPVLMDFRIGKTQWKPRSEAQTAPGVLEWRPDVESAPAPKEGDIWWWDKKLVRDLILGWETEDPEAYTKKLIEQQSIVPDEEWPQERMVEFFREIYRKIEEFYAP